MDLQLITKLLIAPDSYNISSVKNILVSTILHYFSPNWPSFSLIAQLIPSNGDVIFLIPILITASSFILSLVLAGFHKEHVSNYVK